MITFIGKASDEFGWVMNSKTVLTAAPLSTHNSQYPSANDCVFISLVDSQLLNQSSAAAAWFGLFLEEPTVPAAERQTAEKTRTD